MIELDIHQGEGRKMKAKISALTCLVSIIILNGIVGIARTDPVAIVRLSLPPGPPPSVNSIFQINVEIIAPPTVEVYAWAVMLRFEPYGQAIVAVNATEGPFLPGAGPTKFAYLIDTFQGRVKIANTLLTPQCTGGASCGPGPRLLAKVYFACAESGQTWIELDDCQLLDCNLNPIACDCHDLPNLIQQ